MFKFIIYLLVFIFFTGCSFSKYRTNEISEIGNIQENQIKNTFSNCSNDTFIANINHKKYGRLFIENIDLNFDCTWNGLERGYFEDLFEENLNLHNIEIIERIDYKNYEFTSYLIDDKYYLNLIYKFAALKDIFILDYEGKLSKELLQKYGQKFKIDFSNNRRFDGVYNGSLVEKNIINIYFQKERNFIYKD